MTKLTRREIASFAALTDEQLAAWWKAIDMNPVNRVKSGPHKGCLKMSAIRQSDKVLAEMHRRRNLQPLSKSNSDRRYPFFTETNEHEPL